MATHLGRATEPDVWEQLMVTAEGLGVTRTSLSDSWGGQMVLWRVLRGLKVLWANPMKSVDLIKLSPGE